VEDGADATGNEDVNGEDEGGMRDDEVEREETEDDTGSVGDGGDGDGDGDGEGVGEGEGLAEENTGTAAVSVLSFLMGAGASNPVAPPDCCADERFFPALVPADGAVVAAAAVEEAEEAARVS